MLLSLKDGAKAGRSVAFQRMGAMVQEKINKDEL